MTDAEDEGEYHQMLDELKRLAKAHELEEADAIARIEAAEASTPEGFGRLMPIGGLVKSGRVRVLVTVLCPGCGKPVLRIVQYEKSQDEGGLDRLLSDVDPEPPNPDPVGPRWSNPSISTVQGVQGDIVLYVHLIDKRLVGVLCSCRTPGLTVDIMEVRAKIAEAVELGASVKMRAVHPRRTRKK